MAVAISSDGTQVPYVTRGAGPGIILIHGSFECGASHSDLADLLSQQFTAITYNRRGRLDNPDYGSAYSMATEVADVEAILKASGAEYLFGVSSGGLICLNAARSLGNAVKKVSVYEPVFVINKSTDLSLVDRYRKEIAAGKIDAALVTSMLAAQMGPPALRYVPRFLLEWMTRKVLDARPGGKDTPSMREYAPTVGADFQLVQEMADSIDTFRDLETPVLIMGGDKSPAYLRTCLPPLEKALPNSKRIEFKSFDHGASGNKNFRGKPDAVAEEIISYFTGK